MMRVVRLTESHLTALETMVRLYWIGAIQSQVNDHPESSLTELATKFILETDQVHNARDPLVAWSFAVNSMAKKPNEDEKSIQAIMKLSLYESYRALANVDWKHYITEHHDNENIKFVVEHSILANSHGLAAAFENASYLDPSAPNVPPNLKTPVDMN